MTAAGWVAAAVGWVALWLCGCGHRTGWLLMALASAAWTAINAGLRLWPGVVASAVAAGIAARNALRPAVPDPASPSAVPARFGRDSS